MSVLMRSVSGIRGIVGESLTPILLLQYVNAFLQLTQAKKVIIGRDSRISGPLLEQVVAQGCAAYGAEAVVLGLATTPTVELMVPLMKAGAGIIVTASHNPGEWNALKFLNKDGIFLNQSEVENLFNLVDNRKFRWAGYRGLGKITQSSGADDKHIDAVLSLPFIDAHLIRSKKIKVAYDGVNGAGSHIVPALLEKLGCEVHALNVTPNGEFPHNPEPTPENLKDLSQLVKEKQCQVGFATDPDADRCAAISEEGVAVGEEYTLVLAALLYLEHHKTDMAVNLSTSRMIEDLAADRGVSVHRSKVGEVNVSMLMQKKGCRLGGEGNGGVILADLHYGRDGILAIAMVLQLLAQSSKKLSELCGEVPRYHIEKQKFTLGGKTFQDLLVPLRDKFVDCSLNEEDGLRFSWDKKWIHVRPSNTEPVVRAIAEAPTRDEAVELCGTVEGLIR